MRSIMKLVTITQVGQLHQTAELAELFQKGLVESVSQFSSNHRGVNPRDGEGEGNFSLGKFGRT